MINLFCVPVGSWYRLPASSQGGTAGQSAGTPRLRSWHQHRQRCKYTLHFSRHYFGFTSLIKPFSSCLHFRNISRRQYILLHLILNWICSLQYWFNFNRTQSVVLEVTINFTAGRKKLVSPANPPLSRLVNGNSTLSSSIPQTWCRRGL